jgi:YVTN family beta-propeller protein
MKQNKRILNKIPLAPFIKGEYLVYNIKLQTFFSQKVKPIILGNIASGRNYLSIIYLNLCKKAIPPFQRGLGGFVFLLLFVFSMESCMDDDRIIKPLRTYQEKGVFILNEGNFTYSNASLSYYKPDSNIVLNDVFYNTNELPLGDVAQSMCIQDSLAYIVLNNSGKVYVINKNTFNYVGKITGLTSPRHMLIINPAKAYISDLYSGSISIVDPLTYAIIGEISTGHHKSTEQMLFWQNKVYTNCWSYDNKILVIDATTDAIVDSITVGKQPNSMVIDKNNHLWVLSDGGFPGSSYGQENASLSKIDLATNELVKTFTFTDMDASPTHMQINASKDSIFYIYGNWGTTLSNSGVHVMSITDNQLPQPPIIQQVNCIFYALGIDPETHEIYVSNAKDYSQNGEIYRCSPNGTPKDTIDVGITPGFFYFDN